MYQVQQVLVPLDFSSFSRSALAFARQLGPHHEHEKGGQPVRLQLAHAVEAMPSYVRSLLFPYAALGEDDREFEAEIVDSALRELERYFDIDEPLRQRFIGEPIVEFGSTEPLIRRWRGRFDVDMIVAGAFGANGVYAAGPGSTSRRLAATATQPVALIRDHESMPEIDRILVALELGSNAQRVIEVAVALAIDLGAELELLHVAKTPFEGDLKPVMQRHVEIEADQLKAAMRPQIEGLFNDIVETIKFPHSIQSQADELCAQRTLCFGEPAREIVGFAHDGGFDLIVIGSGQQDAGALGDVASSVMARAPSHMVVVPARQRATPLNRWSD